MLYRRIHAGSDPYNCTKYHGIFLRTRHQMMLEQYVPIPYNYIRGKEKPLIQNV